MSAIIRIINEHQGEVCTARYTLCGLSIVITDGYLVCNETCLILTFFRIFFCGVILVKLFCNLSGIYSGHRSFDKPSIGGKVGSYLATEAEKPIHHGRQH